MWLLKVIVPALRWRAYYGIADLSDEDFVGALALIWLLKTRQASLMNALGEGHCMTTGLSKGLFCKLYIALQIRAVTLP